MSAAITELAPGIFWMAPEHETDRPALGAIAGDRATLMVDAGASNRHAQQFLDALATKPVPPPSHVVLTHSHWDHVFGAPQVDAVPISTEETRDEIAKMATYAWDDAALDDRVRDGTEIAFCRDMIKAELTAGERAELTVRVPERTFQDELTIDLGNRSVQVLAVGGDHASDSCIVVLPGVAAFLSDCAYIHLHSEPNYFTRRRMFPLLDRLLALDVPHYVLGHHDAPLTRPEFESFAQALRSAGEAVQQNDPAMLDGLAVDALPHVSAFQAGLTHETD